MLVNCIKRLFIVMVFRKNEYPFPDDNSFLVFHTSFRSYLNVLLDVYRMS